MNLNNRNISNIQFVKAVQDKLSKYSKTLSVFGLTTSKNVQIKESPDSGLYVIPCIYVPSGATGLVYLDYNTTPQSDSVKQFFDIIPAGATLSIQNAEYNYNEASLSGFTCTFVEIFNNIAVFSGITIPHLNSSVLKYYPEKFDFNLKIVLQSTINSPLAKDLLNIENYFPNGDNSFITNGVVVVVVVRRTGVHPGACCETVRLRRFRLDWTSTQAARGESASGSGRPAP